MNESINKDFVGKITDRARRYLKIQEVYLNSELHTETIKYLQKQRYLEFLEINKVIKNNFISTLPFGYVIKDKKNNIVGFMGTIFSKRIYDNKEYIYCNIHSWVVDSYYRINSFFLLTSLIEQKITLTAFTPVKSLIGLLKKFDFKTIKIKYRVVCFFNFLIFQKNNNYIIEKKSSIIKEKLNSIDLIIYEDYYKLPYEKFLIIDKNDGSKYIFVIASRIKKKGINILNLFHISNITEFKKNWHKFKFNISKEFKVNFFSQYFFNNSSSALPNDIFLSTIKEKDILVKNILPSINLDILYSDLIE